MWHLGTWLSDGLGSAELMVGLKDLRDFVQPKWLYNSLQQWLQAFFYMSRHQLRCMLEVKSVQLQINNSFGFAIFQQSVTNCFRLISQYVLLQWKCICFSSWKCCLSTGSQSTWSVLLWAVGCSVKVTCNRVMAKSI